ncbi:hypothetical protein [Protofrankia coriariae]|uniref:hypothetical protein n=1 Tax=Protofrankia coriariae TaxID=1562887 RepID=UPI00069A873C|nr:hypothetical protein [Protofrankia coriariae]
MTTAVTVTTVARTWWARAVLALLVAVLIADTPEHDAAGGGGVADGAARAAHATQVADTAAARSGAARPDTGTAGLDPGSGAVRAVEAAAGAGAADVAARADRALDISSADHRALDAGSDAVAQTPVTLARGSASYSLAVQARHDGEGVAEVTARAPGVDWAVPGAESAVLAIAVDGVPATDLVVPAAHPIIRQVQLGRLRAGAHTLTITLDGQASSAGAQTVVIDELSVSAVAPRTPGAPDPLVYAPILYGRSLPEFGGLFQNNHTDTPLLAWHTQAPVAGRPGHTVLEYSVMFSNEDGGTGDDPGYLQARWGRQTDIEWVYRVELDAAGSVVPGSAVYQGPNHVTLPFTGRYENGHPVLRTCTGNNMVCAVIAGAGAGAGGGAGGMRFFLAADHELAAGEAREQMMDAAGWTYQLSAAEARREEKIEPVASAYTPALSDLRNYLYVVIRKTTSVPAVSVASVAPALAWVGTTVGVRLAGDPDVLYRSDHMISGWSVQQDGAVATAVELPPGTKLADIATLEVLRAPAGVVDPGSTVTVTGVERAIMLDADGLPAPGSLTWSGRVTLTASEPDAVLVRP